MSIYVSGGKVMRLGGGGIAVASQVLTALDHPANGVAGGDIAQVFDGSILVSRFNQTVLWKERPNAITGYQAVTWNSPNDGIWDGGAYSCGMHGHPCDGTFDASGQRQNGTSSSGTVLYSEIAGMNAAADYIASPSSPGPQSTFLHVGGAWRNRARLIFPNAANTDHYFYPDLVSRPTEFIKQVLVTTSIGAGGANPAFYFGASDWTPAGSGNTETIDGLLRGQVIFSPALTNMTHVLAISALETDAQVLAYCAANSLLSSLWYLNMNPTPTDITDKSGNGRNPAWRNANRPGLWTSP